MIFFGKQLKLKWSWWYVPALIPVLLYAQCYHYRHSLTREEALEEAVITMRSQCRSYCAEYGIKLEDLQGPIEAQENIEPKNQNYWTDNKGFSFTWTAENGTELMVTVWDNGAFINIDQWWTRPKDKLRLQPPNKTQ